jgi:hypothetical protein
LPEQPEPGRPALALGLILLDTWRSDHPSGHRLAALFEGRVTKARLGGGEEHGGLLPTAAPVTPQPLPPDKRPQPDQRFG